MRVLEGILNGFEIEGNSLYLMELPFKELQDYKHHPNSAEPILQEADLLNDDRCVPLTWSQENI